MTSGNLNTRWG